jgi:hypothetical protein
MVLVRLHRYEEARDRLAEGMKAHPDRSEFARALARLLAAAPDDRVRNGRRALAIANQLFTQHDTDGDLGETMAMTLAELGRFEEAATLQRSWIAAAERAGRDDVVRRMTENLRRYEARQACRTPWTEENMP